MYRHEFRAPGQSVFRNKQPRNVVQSATPCRPPIFARSVAVRPPEARPTGNGAAKKMAPCGAILLRYDVTERQHSLRRRVTMLPSGRRFLTVTERQPGPPT